eukprot:scaffold114516_cov70-Phaeocystis_antarctica.AAC.2
MLYAGAEDRTGAGRGDRPAVVATRCIDQCVGEPKDRHLKVVLIRAPLDVENKLGPVESAACEGTRLPPVHGAQLQSERHVIEVCNLREKRDSDALMDVLVRTERRVCLRRNPSAGVV